MRTKKPEKPVSTDREYEIPCKLSMQVSVTVRAANPKEAKQKLMLHRHAKINYTNEFLPCLSAIGAPIDRGGSPIRPKTSAKRKIFD